VSKENT